jgi:hypothetical protein
MPSAAGLPRDRLRRHRLLHSPAGVAGERQAMPSGRHGKRWGECRVPARSQWPAPLRHLRSRDRRARRRTEARRGRRHHAGAQQPASRASGLDRIVGMMSASGPHDALASNCGRGATTGPPSCSAQSSPVVFRSCCCMRLQGLTASWHDWRGQKVFLIRKRSQVRVLDRPSAGIQEFPAYEQFSENLAARRSDSQVPSWGHNGATSITGGRESAPGFGPAARRRRTPRTPSTAD